MRRYTLTPAAAEHLDQIGVDTNKRWGRAQTRKYLSELRDGFQRIADRHEILPIKQPLASVADLRVSAIKSHLAAFIVLSTDHTAIVDVLHQHMDVSTRLRELQNRTANEVGDIRAELLRDQFKD